MSAKLKHGHRKGETFVVPRISNGRATYQLGAEIGRGGFAVVFQALNVETGDFVAVKRFPLSTVDEESLASIEGEIELMKKLNHDNIVQYVDTIRTNEYLHIVLEFMENGSLAGVIKKYGSFSESLTAIYITQVLRGLKYLHEQGVLHRDIKGANILTTKDGQVKLADFGVAMKLSDSHVDEQDVVGTPYWMAPEIIEMSTPTASCDIWSVGCTIVELLTSKPPYYELAPMAALFRIVQDDYPPLPDSISEALRDFLLQCFQKEPVMRKSASELLNHPWLLNSSKHLNRSGHLVTQTSGDDEHRTTVANTVRLFVEKERQGQLVASETTEIVGEFTIKANRSSGLLVAGQPGGGSPMSSPDVASPTIPLRPKSIIAPPTVPEEEDEDWGDFGQLVSEAPKIAKSGARHLASPSVDDLNDFLGSSDITQTSPARLRLQPVSMPGSARINFSRFQEQQSQGDDLDNFDDDLEVDAPLDDANPEEEGDGFKLKLLHTADNGEEDDEFLKNDMLEDSDFQQRENKDLITRRSKEIMELMAQIKNDCTDEEVADICVNLTEMFDKYPEQKEQLIALHGVIPILEIVEIESPIALQHTLQVVNKIVSKNRKAQEQLSLVGMIPIMIRFLDEGAHLEATRLEVAKFIQNICETSDLVLQMLIGAGGLLALVKLISFSVDMTVNEGAHKCVVIAVDCILKVFTSQTSRTDFCRLFTKFHLLPPLADALRRSMATSKLLETPAAWTESLKIAQILLNFGRSGEKVAVRIATEGPLTVVLSGLQDDKLTAPMPVPLTVPTHTRSRSHVRTSTHTRSASMGWAVALSVHPEYIDFVETLLKIVKNTSMEPSARDHMEGTNAIPILCALLDGSLGDRVKNHILPCMYNLCRVSKKQQEQAAVCGLIPHLQKLIKNNSHLRQFALPIMCYLGHCTVAARQKLWEHDGVSFYLSLLHDSYWQTVALGSLSQWLWVECPRVEGLLVLPSNLSRLVDFFRSASQRAIGDVHEAFLRMMSKSSKLSKALGGSGLFVAALVGRLRSSENLVLRSLLKMLQLLHQHHPNPRQLVLDFDLYTIVRSFAQDESQVLVYQSANRLLRDFQHSTLA